jgi:hypothetical protein
MNEDRIIMTNHEDGRATNESEPFQEIDAAFLLRLQQLGDQGLQAAMRVLNRE